MDHTSAISAFQSILLNYRFEESQSFSEDFAQKRYLKKMELPDRSRSKERRQKAFLDWVEFDQSLPDLVLLPGNWYKARLLCHKAMGSFRLGSISFTNGSEFTSTRGQGSLEAKLSRSRWGCSRENFDLWAETAYSNRALKVAARKRFLRQVLREYDSTRDVRKAISRFSRDSYKMAIAQKAKDPAFFCFKRMLSRVTFIAEGNRFSTVRKNNEKDRPICMENLCDMLVQRRIGNGIRDVLLGHFGIDLDHLAEKHRDLIRDFTKATIDLKNASDSISLQLVRFMLPTKVYNYVSSCRSYMTYGLDGHYHVPKKVSSMGNGFTFELMTLLLLCLGRQYDNNFSVFGDDIIVDTDVAPRVISDLEAVGFVVNKEKSFLSGDFRESCGGNFHAVEGYVESYDFEYPETIHDCIVVYNKVSRLSLKYRSFKKLRGLLTRPIPLALRGTFSSNTEHAGPDQYQDPDLTTYFKVNPKGTPHRLEKKSDLAKLKVFSDAIQVSSEDHSVFYGFEFKSDEASAMPMTLRPRKHWAKYLMYLHSARRTRDVITGSGTWVPIAYVRIGKSVYRWKSVLAHVSALKRVG